MLLALVAAACSSASSSPGDGTAKFAGKWVYQSGSTVVEDCANAPELTIDLSKVMAG
jgi:type 1 fimbria pilin